MKTNEIKNKMLSTEQEIAVKTGIMKSMRESYINVGTIPDPGFENAAGAIAERVVRDVQMALMQSNVFKKIVDTSKPLKTNKKKKNGK